MLLVMMDEQLFAAEAVCQGCLMADQQGQPRFHRGRLTCGRLLAEAQPEQTPQYECQMGFRLANINP